MAGLVSGSFAARRSYIALESVTGPTEVWYVIAFLELAFYDRPWSR